MTTDPRTVIRDKVAAVVHTHYPNYCNESCNLFPKTVGNWAAHVADAAIAAHLQALEEASRIDTVEQLDALPPRSVIRDADGDVHEQDNCGFWH